MKSHADGLVDTAEIPHIADGIAATQRIGNECQLETWIAGAAAERDARKADMPYRHLHGACERHGVGWSGRASVISRHQSILLIIQGLNVMTPEASTIVGDQSVEQLRRELAEAREQQTATAEILRVISARRWTCRTCLHPSRRARLAFAMPMMRQSIGWTATFSPLSPTTGRFQHPVRSP